MAISTLEGKVVPVKLWAPANEVESSAIDQLKDAASLPWAYHHVAAMPDVHYGRGATVGSVIALNAAIAPCAVGVDIGCGMAAVKTNLDPDKVMKKITRVRETIEHYIPVGYSSHTKFVADKLLNEDLADEVKTHMAKFSQLRATQQFEAEANLQMGTLGGGNHFIELCIDTGDEEVGELCESCGDRRNWEGCGTRKCGKKTKSRPNVWLMLHSGSRRIGKELAEYHINIAKSLAHNEQISNKDMAVFLEGTPQMAAYEHDLMWAQEYARLNRMTMLDLYFRALMVYWPGLRVEDTILCHHNYVAKETHFDNEVYITRKGAISAREGEMGIIPGSMGTKSYIVRGLGNPESFHSASHGAGRKMSRGQAKKKFTKKDLEEQTKGVECRKDDGVLDEIPGAYKSIEKVMENQKDLVEIVAELKQLICIKG